MVEESADKSYELCLIDIHESVSTCLWKTTLVCPMVVWGRPDKLSSVSLDTPVSIYAR